jgi:hypothetical protein
MTFPLFFDKRVPEYLSKCKGREDWFYYPRCVLDLPRGLGRYNRRTLRVDERSFRDMEPTPATRLRWILLVLAGLVVLSAGMWLVVQRNAGPGTGIPASGTTGVDLPQQEDVYPAPGELLSEPPPRLRWPWQPAAVAYRVQVTSLESGLLWQSQSTGATELALPGDVRDTLAEGGEFLWRVEISGPAPTSELGPFRFSVR